MKKIAILFAALFALTASAFAADDAKDKSGDTIVAAYPADAKIIHGSVLVRVDTVDSLKKPGTAVYVAKENVPAELLGTAK